MTCFNIEETIERLEGSRLESQLPFRPLRGDLERHFVALHVTALARFWGEARIDLGTLVEQHRRLFTGFQASAATWAFLALAQPDNLSFFFLLPGRDACGQWASLFRAVLPGCELLEGPLASELSKALGAFEHVAAMTGNPSMASAAEGESKPQVPKARLESVFRALQGQTWAYLVIARPVAEEDLENSCRALAGEEQELVSSYLRRGTAEEYNNPTAKRCLELLQAARLKHEAGRREGMWDTQTYLFANGQSELTSGIHALSGAFGGPDSRPEPLRVRQCRVAEVGSPQELPVTRLTTGEVVALACLPGQEFAGYCVKDYVRFAVSPRSPDQSERVALGVILDDGQETGNWFEVGRDQFSKHAFIAGVPGSGKTNTAQFLLRQLWEDHHVPWLVLEPSVKSEYRRLLQSPVGDALRIFTLGNETGVPLRFNPLEVQPGVQVQTQVDSLAALFSAAFPLFPPMPTVLYLALNRVYADRGWDAAKGTNPRGYVAEVQPTLSDLYAAVERVAAERGYDPQVTANIRSGLQTRLSSLMVGGKGLMFNTGSPVPFSVLLSHPTIFEFSALGDDDEKAFVLGAVLLRLMQYRQATGLTGGRLVHVTLVEEAHRLLRQVAETVGTEAANPRGKAVETFCNMLAESRAYGEGIIVVEQIPSKLAADVVKNTSLRIVHRLDSEGDRRLVGGMMNLRGEQERFLTGLLPGRAVASAEGWTEGCWVSVPNSARHRGYEKLNPTTDQVTAHMRRALPEAFAVSSAPVSAPSPRVPLPECQGCVPGGCRFRRVLLREISRCRYADFRDAVGKGWRGLWEYGETRARSAGVATHDLPDGTYCFLMNLASVCRFEPKAIAMMRRELQVIRDWKRQASL